MSTSKDPADAEGVVHQPEVVSGRAHGTQWTVIPHRAEGTAGDGHCLQGPRPCPCIGGHRKRPIISIISITIRIST